MCTQFLCPESFIFPLFKCLSGKSIIIVCMFMLCFWFIFLGDEFTFKHEKILFFASLFHDTCLNSLSYHLQLCFFTFCVFSLDRHGKELLCSQMIITNKSEPKHGLNMVINYYYSCNVKRFLGGEHVSQPLYCTTQNGHYLYSGRDLSSDLKCQITASISSIG